MSAIPSANLLGYPVHLVDQASALSVFKSHLNARQNCHVVTLNPEMLMQGESDSELGAVLKQADLTIPDGAGVVWALNKQGHSIERLPGIELSEACLSYAASHHKRVALIGASPEVHEAATQTLKAKYPQLTITYAHHGYMNDEKAVAEACAATHPDFVFVGLGVPKQEFWINRYKNLFHGSVFIGVGGSLDVWSGLKQRAPDFFLKTNLEWFYRISSEPWRIKRTYKTLPLFVIKVLMSQS